MSRVERIENEIQSLSGEELAQFRAWFAEFDWGRWDADLLLDVDTGRLDQVAEEALREHDSGRTTPL